MRSEPLGPQQGVGQVKQQAQRDETGEGIIEDHGRSPQSVFPGRDPGWVPVRAKKTRQNLKPFADVAVTDRRHEEAEAEGQHDDVQHELLLCAVIRETGERPSLSLAVSCHPAHRFSRCWQSQCYRNLINVGLPAHPHTYEIPIFRPPASSRFQMAFWPPYGGGCRSRPRSV